MLDSIVCRLASGHRVWVGCIFCVLIMSSIGNAQTVDELMAVDFGVKADGTSDDGPAILRMVEAARAANRPVRLVFPDSKTIFAATGKDRYLFQLDRTRNITIDGSGSTFVLDPGIRMASIDAASDCTLRNFRVDSTVSMFIESVIESVDDAGKFVDVRVLDEPEASNLGGPTKQDGEQWFGGFVWRENGPNPKAAWHFAVDPVEQLGNGRARIFLPGNRIPAEVVRTIKPGETRFSIPRPGVAHRFGPGAQFVIHDSRNVVLERIAVWSAPWFAFNIHRNEGICRFTDVDVVPKPDSGRLMSACRDAFHVTANRATIVFDGCDIAGTGDDDYNLCILSSRVVEVLGPRELIIRQKFPIQFSPMRPGDTLMVSDADDQMIGSAKIAGYTELPLDDGSTTVPGGRSPRVRIVLESEIPGMKAGLNVWSREGSNPDTTIRNGTMNFSNRFQTPVTLERCKLTCLNVCYGMKWSNGDNVEGPGPEFVRVIGCEFRTGRGTGLKILCGNTGPIERSRVRRVQIEDSTFHAPLQIDQAQEIVLTNNQFHDTVRIGRHTSLEMTGNRRDGKPFEESDLATETLRR